MLNDCFFRRAAQGQLPQYNRRNIITVLRTVVKSHKGLKRTKGTLHLPMGILEEISKISQNLQKRARAGVLSL